MKSTTLLPFNKVVEQGQHMHNTIPIQNREDGQARGSPQSGAIMACLGEGL